MATSRAMDITADSTLSDAMNWDDGEKQVRIAKVNSMFYGLHERQHISTPSAKPAQNIILVSNNQFY